MSYKTMLVTQSRLTVFLLGGNTRDKTIDEIIQKDAGLILAYEFGVG